ncbi:hypothetical protein HBI56_073430 [Parastagonospora nodorum]|uniref:Uncharacterized protein n=1 Tax=Phaeosphaeria nodorum (strain SN15 / ATCC MYA-4574 / FGSC 10173) TaxID=321614 RepID=A0A7U2HZN7_PHANO|nr:hypothetical protein HBH56_171530 [Parastagonospora nodorum]QRC94531.1 hypothetical protein JI435_406000 [Parastagonospora nodorum SN15]KAH3928476.1 hypothetical protein HBH54_140090 [Parastagonospora nodorum]KAH3945399.1 hypothetical protein HBH53_145440 [Parastagonospora nodorum]KAH3984190.1 hypothetical protein HBH52_058780 [Parastagonospora nodorum]
MQSGAMSPEAPKHGLTSPMKVRIAALLSSPWQTPQVCCPFIGYLLSQTANKPPCFLSSTLHPGCQTDINL